MKRNKAFLIISIILTLLLMGCGEPNGDSFYRKGSDVIAEQRIQTLIEAVDSGDSELIVDMFASEVIESDSEIDSEAKKLIKFLGHIDSYDYTGGVVEDKSENTTAPYQKYYSADFDLICNGEVISLSISEYAKSNEQAQGVRTIYAIKESESDWRVDMDDPFGVLYHEGIMVDEISLAEVWASYDTATDKSLNSEDLQIIGFWDDIYMHRKFEYTVDPDEIDFEENGDETSITQIYSTFTVVEACTDPIAEQSKDGIEELDTQVVAAKVAATEMFKYHTNRGVFINDPRDKVILKYGEGQEEDNALIYCCEGEGYLKFIFDEQDNVSEIRIYRDVDLLQ